MILILSDKWSASSKWWVVRTIVVYDERKFYNIYQIFRLESGSRPDVGSSNIKT